ELVPDELTIEIWKKWIDARIAESSYSPNEEMLLLAGIPRSVRQCELLEEYVEVVLNIHLAVSHEDVMVRRIQGRALEDNRIDDADEKIIRRRFEVYRETSAPLLSYYPQEIICEVDPIGTHAEILLRILSCLVPAQKKFLERQTAVANRK